MKRLYDIILLQKEVQFLRIDEWGADFRLSKQLFLFVKNPGHEIE